MVNQVIGLIVGASLITTGIVLEGGSPANLVNWNALLITLGGALGATIMCCSPMAVIQAFTHALTGKANGSSSSANVFYRFGRNLLYCGAIGFTFGCIHTFGNMGDWSQFGAGLSVAMLSPLYALILRTFVAVPFEERTRTAGASERHGDQRHLRVA